MKLLKLTIWMLILNISIFTFSSYAQQKPKVPEIRADSEEVQDILDDYEPNSNLYEKDLKALDEVDAYLHQDMDIERDEYGRIILTYGDSLPTIVCSTVVVCDLELQPGEEMTSDYHLGDTVRWAVFESISYQDGQPIQHIIIKPKDIGISTMLFIPTNKRTYNIRLVSVKKRFMPRVAFKYPNETQRLFEKKEQVKKAEIKRQTEIAKRRKFYNYIVKGDKALLPKTIYDDGVKTYIVMPDNIQTLPSLVVKGNHKKTPYKLVNYRVQDDVYIVDRILDEPAFLLLGAGKKQKKVTIERGEESKKQYGKSISLN